MPEPNPTSLLLREVGLPRILIDLKKRRFTGTVRVQRNDQDKSLFFKDGDFIFASSRYADDRLGERLLRHGKITLEQYLISVDLLRKTGKRLGTILVEQGIISPGELFTAVESQVKDILLGLFTWIDGSVEILEGPLPSEEVITLRISTGNVILEGIKRMNDWTLLYKKLPSLEMVPVKTSNPLILYQDIRFSNGESRFVELIDGRRTLARLFGESPLPPFDTLKLIHFLGCIGFIETGEEISMPGEPQPRAASDKIPAAAPPREEISQSTAISSAPETPPAAPPPRPEESPPPPPPKPSPAQVIRDAYSGMETQNDYEVLGLSRTASRDEIKRAYFRLAREYHPDRHLQEGMDGLRPLLETLFKRVTEAYDTLIMESKRREYDSRL